MIYHAPYWLVDWSGASSDHWLIKMEEKIRTRTLSSKIDCGDYDKFAFQIGFQPFMRCHYQSGYVFPMRSSESLQNDFRFERLTFRQSEKLSNMVFEAMEQGEKVFPQEGISLAEEVLEQIQMTNIIAIANCPYSRIAGQKRSRYNGKG